MSVALPLIEPGVLLTCNGRAPALDRTEPILVGYSIKNKSFTRPFFNTIGKICLSHFSHLLVAIFDVPYAFNDAAFANRDLPNAIEVQRYELLGNERAAMVGRVLSKIVRLRYEIRRWPDLDNSAVNQLRVELSSAATSDFRLRSQLIQYTRIWTGSSGRADPERFLGFQIAEIPVLLDLYYNQGYLVDFYPGDLNEFFFDLQRGYWRDSLPKASSLAMGKSLSCISLLPNSI